MKLGLAVNTLGWIGFGLGEDTSGGMAGADIVIAGVKNGVGFCDDRYALAQATPEIDEINDWILKAAEETDSTTYVEMERAIDTGDLQDRAFLTSGLQRIVIAWGETDTFGYHGANREIFAIDFSGSPSNALAAVQSDPNVISFDLLNEYYIESEETVYFEAIHDLANLLNGFSEFSEYQIVGFEHIIDNATAEHVHHLLLSSGQPGGDTSLAQLLWPWARGAKGEATPEQCGFKIDSSNSEIIVQTHFDNPAHTNVGVLDESGVRIYLTPVFREHNCGVLQLGDPFVALSFFYPDMPEGRFLNQFSCPEDCINDEVTIYQSGFHMHNKGSRMWTTHTR